MDYDNKMTVSELRQTWTTQSRKWVSGLSKIHSYRSHGVPLRHLSRYLNTYHPKGVWRLVRGDAEDIWTLEGTREIVNCFYAFVRGYEAAKGE